MSISESELSQLRQESWQKQTKMVPYEVHRPLTGPVTKEPYTFIAGTFRGKDLPTTLATKVSQKRGEEVYYADVGCGAGDALLEVAKRWKGNIVCTGRTSYPYHGPNTELRNYPISVEQKDVQSLGMNYRFDVMSAIHALNYVFDPFLALQQLYAALKIGGVAFVSPFAPVFSKEQEAMQIYSYLSTQYAFEQTTQGGIAFCREKAALTLPLCISGTTPASPVFGTVQAVYAIGE